MRIRGLKAEEDEDGDTIIKPSELSKLIKNFTGIEIMADPDNFKSTYQILLEISKVWDKLTDAQQALLLEKIAGKHRASVIAGLLSDTQELEKALAAAENSTGSAMTEFEKRTQSIQYHLNQLQNAWQVFASNAATVETVNKLIDALTTLVEFMDKVGASTIIVGTAFTSLIAVFSKIYPSLKMAGETLADINKAMEVTETIRFASSLNTWAKSGNEFKVVLAGILSKLSSVFKALKFLSPAILAVGTAFLAFKGISSILDKQKNKVHNLSVSIDDLSSELNDLQSEYDELNEKSLKTDGEEKKLELLQRQIDLKKQQLELEKNKKTDAIVNDTTEYFSGYNTKSNFSDKMNAVQKSAEKYQDKLKWIDEYSEKIDKQKEKLDSLTKGTNAYKLAVGSLNGLQTTQNKTIEEANELQEQGISQLEDMLTLRQDLVYAVENSVGSQKAEAQANLDAFDVQYRNIQVQLGLADSYDTLKKKAAEYTNSCSKLESILNSANSTHKLTSEQMEVLKQEYPDVAEEIEKYSSATADGFELEKEALDVLTGAFETSKKTQISAQIEMTSAAITQSQARITQYQKEASALLSLYNAIADMELPQNITGSMFSNNPLYRNGKKNTSLMSQNFSSGNPLFDINYANSSKKEQEAFKAVKFAQEQARNNKKRLEDLQNELKKISNSSGEKTGSTNPSGVDDSGSGSGSGSSKDDKKKIEIFDKYANRIDKVKESLEAYDDAIDITQAKLDKNQSYEERTNDLMEEESSLYEQLRKQLEEKRKATNDALWQENQDLISLKKNLADITGTDVNSQSFITDLNAWYEQKSLADENFSDSVLGQEIRQKIDAADTLTDHTQELNKELLNTKKEIIDLNDEEITIKFDYQNDILDKYSQQRTIAQTTLDILDNINGAESQRVKLADQLISNYQQENKYLEQAYKENLNYLAKTKQQYTENSQEYIEAARKVAEQNTKLHEQELNNLQAEYNLRKKQLDIQNELNEKAAEYEYYGSAGKEAWEDARQEEIDRLQKELDALDEDNSEEQYLKDLAEKEKQIAELEEKLNNLRSQTTIQQLKPMDDGSYQWEYIVDQKAINETLADLEEARNDLQETQDERALELQKENIQSKIDAIQEEVDEREKQYQRELQLIEDTYESSIDSLDRWLADEVENCNKRIANMEKFNKEYDKTLDTGMKTATATLQANAVALQNTWGSVMSSIVGVIADNVEQALSLIDRMNQALRESQEVAAGGGGDIPGFAKGLKFVESNGMLARLHYGERVLTRSEAAQYNSLEDDIKSGKLQDYFDSLEEDAKFSVSSAISTNISAQKSFPDTTSNTNQFVIENITLPNVNEPADFTSELESWASREFGGLAQKAKIKRAK